MHGVNRKYFLIALFCFTLLVSLLSFFVSESCKHDLIKSDGRGYYAYLPALILFQDPSYQKVIQAEKKNFEGRNNQTYLFTNEEGDAHNKYFPGVAVLQSPFFIIATFISYITGGELDGYSGVYLACFWLGSLFYSILGLFFLFKTLEKYTQNTRAAFLTTFLVFFATQLFFNILMLPSLSHNYSFFLFTFLSYLFLRFENQPDIKKAILAGILLGLIFLVRPTNIIFVLFLPFLLKEKIRFRTFLKTFFEIKKGYFIYFIISVCLVSCFLLVIWKWQTGNWIVWSYSGEGFDFTHPKIIETLFSYRIGIFLHTPLLFFSLVGLYYVYKLSSLIFVFWFGYFSILIFITSSWWCWDYESVFGHRALSEHFIIFSFPLALIISKNKSFKTIIIILSLLFIYNASRFIQLKTGVFPLQRFTTSTFYLSFFDFDTQPPLKYNFLQHCFPLGKSGETVILSYDDEDLIGLNYGEEYTKALTYDVSNKNFNNRFVFEIQFDKTLLENNDNWHSIFLVFDAFSIHSDTRIYQAIPIYEYYKEGKNSIHTITMQHEVPVAFNPVDQISIYIWNQKRKKIKLSNFTIKAIELVH